MEKTVIITAGGFGKRMNSDTPKQFLLLHDKSILHHTIEKLYLFDQSMEIIVVLPKEWIVFWKAYCSKVKLTINHQVIEGGKERFHSVQNALNFASGEFIAVHDAVRPFVSLDVLNSLFSKAKEKGNAIPIVPVKESIRFLDDLESKALDRSHYFLVQTPQVFKREILLDAYQKEFHKKITDDASLLEECGVKINLVEGNEENIKITSPLDLEIAKILLKSLND